MLWFNWQIQMLFSATLNMTLKIKYRSLFYVILKIQAVHFMSLNSIMGSLFSVLKILRWIMHLLNWKCVLCNVKLRLALLRILRRFDNISVISPLGSRRYPITEIEVQRLWLEPRTSYFSSQEQVKSLTTPPLPLHLVMSKANCN